MKRTLTFLFLTITFAHLLFSQAGELDPSFAENGVFRGTYSDLQETPYQVIVQPDNKLLVTFSGHPAGNSDACVARLHEDGSIDSTFANNGLYFYSTPSFSDGPADLALLDDGSMIMAGSSAEDPTDPEFLLIKLTSEGVLDTSFGVNGVITHQIVDGGQDYINSIAITDDGEILVGGNAHYPNSVFRRNALVRYRADGTLDPLFGDDGIFLWQEDQNYNSTEAIALGDDGSIYTAGYATPFGANRPAVYKIRPDGSGLDVSFADNGQALVPTTGRGFGMALHPNGNILITHESGAALGTDLGITAFLPDGSLNMDFGVDGLFTIDNALSDIGKDLVVQPDGKILACAESGQSFANNQFLTVRIDENGVLDTSWGGTGKVTFQPTNANFSFPNAIAMQPEDGKILVTGVGAFFTDGANEVIVIRYNNEIDADMDGFYLGIDDCDDTNADIFPGNTETPYNGIDDDCDPLTPDDDLDGDGFLMADDCDDMNAAVNPDAVEIPDNDVDEDCDGNISTAVHESFLSQQFSVFPNPTDEVVFLNYKNPALQPSKIVIVDIVGRVLRTIQNDLSSSQIAIPLTNFPSGNLILSIHTEKGIVVKRIVKI